MGMGGQRHALGALCSSKSPDTYSRGGWVGTKQENYLMPRKGFEPRTVQSVASRYTDYTNV
jgi:hypothetical protein